MSSLGRLAVAGTVVALVGAAIGTDDNSSAPLADPPLPRERALGPHPPAYDQNADLHPFDQREVCRATLATMNSRDPLAYQETRKGSGVIWFEFVRASDRKRFTYGCRIEPGQVRIKQDESRWNENNRYFYKVSPGHVQIEQWFMPNTPQRELVDLQTFIKAQFNE